MPGTRCAVAICNNSLQKTKEGNLAISYHTFPKDDKLRKVWVNACRRKDQWNPKTSVICSIHFKQDDFEMDLRSQLMGVKTKKKLKPSAFPTLHLTKEEELLSPTSRGLQTEKCKQKKEVLEVIDENLMDKPYEQSMTTSTDLSLPVMEPKTIEEKYAKLLKKHQFLRNKYNQLRQQFSKQKKNMLKIKKENSENLTKLEKIFAHKVELENAMSSLLSPTQVDILLNKKHKVVWRTEDISKAFALRYLSRRCYIYLRNELKYPLPHVSSLRRWASKLKFRQGMLYDVLRIMKVAAITKAPLEMVTILQFDEMKVESTYEFDKVQDEILGPYNQLQVIMARGLFSNWKQPIYIDFDKKITGDILFEAISQLDNIGYNVVACVSDCGGGNVGLWGQLGISTEKTYFIHPSTSRKIFFFPDAPHLLKLIRNWLLDTGFILPDGSEITADPLQDLLKLTSQELTICHKLSQKHLNCRGPERQNVGLAAQLLSHETATALIQYEPGDNKKLAKDVGNFIEIVSTWFNIMNSYTPTHSQNIRKPYGKLLEDQNKSLTEMYDTFKEMKCCGKNGLQTFQKGVLMSINSLKSLFLELKKNYNFDFILTHRLNQDSLESFFSQVRSIGGLHDHPSPLNALHRIRLIVLGKNPGVVQDNLNIQVEPNAPREEYIVANVISRADLHISDTQIKSIEPGHESDSETISSSSSSSVMTERIQESDGFKYLCGWLAKKFKTKYPYMGIYTKEIKEDHTYVLPNWLQHLSFGGLTTPSDKWLEQANICEKLFKKFHKTEFKMGPGITKKILNIIKKKCNDIPEEVIKAFIIQRIYIRIKCLNAAKKDESRKRKFEGSSRKVKRKIKKIVT